MAKPKAPLLSLKAHGTLADTLTFQKRGSGTITRRKPTPTITKTLPQLYQRWLYEDYIALWHQQTTTTKHLWETNARPHHMTGFAYWMQYCLLLLPDLVGLYRFDRVSAGTTPDSSKKNHTATVIGASITTGPIHRALHCDGYDDRIVLPNTNILFPANYPFSIELFVTPHVELAYWLYYYWFTYTPQGAHCIFFRRHTQANRFEILDATNTRRETDLPSSPLNQTHHFCVTYNGTTFTTYWDGSFIESNNWSFKGFGPGPTYIGDRGPNIAPLHCVFDNLALYTRALIPSEIKTHSERRYPL